jgi:hypothetical protein
VTRNGRITMTRGGWDLERVTRETDPEATLPAVARMRRLPEQLEAEHVVVAGHRRPAGVATQTMHRAYRHLEEG